MRLLMSKRSIPVPELRGIDRRCFDERGSWSSILVNAPCDRGVETLCRRREIESRPLDLLKGLAEIDEEKQDRAIFVYQLTGHEWTQIEGRGYMDYFGVAESLSRKLETRSFVHEYEDCGGAYVCLV